jgi:hypothetical protein
VIRRPSIGPTASSSLQCSLTSLRIEQTFDGNRLAAERERSCRNKGFMGYVDGRDAAATLPANAGGYPADLVKLPGRKP